MGEEGIGKKLIGIGAGRWDGNRVAKGFEGKRTFLSISWDLEVDKTCRASGTYRADGG